MILGVARLVFNQDYLSRLSNTASKLAMMLTMAAQMLSLTACFLAICLPFGFAFTLTCSLLGFLIAFLCGVIITSCQREATPRSLLKGVGSTIYWLSSPFFHLDCQKTRGSLVHQTSYVLSITHGG
jgi:hypothetical protein